MAKGEETQQLIVQTALALLDEDGVEALSLRGIGRATGLHHTAVYRHFQDLNGVLRAVNAMLMREALGELLPLPSEPRERLVVVFRALRRVLHEHPKVSWVLLLPEPSLTDSSSIDDFQALVIAALRDMGLEGRDLVLHHRLLETYVFGASIFDFGGAPDHLTSRRERLQRMRDASFEEAARGIGDVDAVNEAGFELGLRVLLDACEQAGTR